MIIQEEKFESEILGLKVGRITNTDEVKQLAEEQTSFDFILVECDLKNTATIKKLEEKRFRAKSVVITSECLIKKEQKKNLGIIVREMRSTDIEGLKNMSRNAFVTTLWYREEGIHREKADEIYATWIENSCKGRSDVVYVAVNEQDKPIGYIACIIKEENGEKRGHIDLIAVDKNENGKGIGTALVNTAIIRYKEKGFEKVSVRTEVTNYGALRLYEKNGFYIVNSALKMSKHLRGS